MVEATEALVIGAGPDGLACATSLAQKGVKVILAERAATIGPKVCAGGITWGGLLRHVPPSLVERSFPEQHIITPRQRVVIAEKNPIIATVSRSRLGQWMESEARAAGVVVLLQTKLIGIEKNRAILETEKGRRLVVCFDHLVGADGSNSFVRRALKIPTTAMGVGLNCMLPGAYRNMEWHLHSGRFGSGYGWIFPHTDVVSIGAYSEVNNLSARTLKDRLLRWAASIGLPLSPHAIRAGMVNFDYRGIRFDRTWLVGDAAGLASGLTGEGISPALLSGRAVAQMILNPDYVADDLHSLIRQQQRHRWLVSFAGRHSSLRGAFMEAFAMGLRLNLLNFHVLEMTP